MVDLLPTLPTEPTVLDKVSYGSDEGHERTQRSSADFCDLTKQVIAGGLTSDSNTGKKRREGGHGVWLRDREVA